MRAHIGWLATISALLACATAQAIPPPWELESGKAAAELILIARTTTSSVVKAPPPGSGFRRMKIGLEPIEVLKGKLPEAGGKKPKLVLLYGQRLPAPGMLRPAVVGGTGHPKPADGETALLFLKRQGEEGSFGAVCGSFGYVSLEVKTQAELDKLTRRIGWFRRFCRRLKDEAVRKAMNGYYDKAAAEAAKRLAAHAAGPAPWRPVAGQSPTYVRAKANEVVLRGTLVAKNVGKPGVTYVRPPMEYSLKTPTRTVRLGPPMDGVFGPLAGKTVEVKGKMQPLRRGSKKTFLLVGWVREVKPPAPARKPKPQTRPAPRHSPPPRRGGAELEATLGTR
jgi:hypothetical protein